MRARSRIALALGGVLLASGLAACSDNGPAPGEARLDLDGSARVTAAEGGATRTLTDSATVRNGEVVEAIDGTFRLTFPNGAQIEGREAHGAVGSSKVRIDDTPALLGGDVVVLADQGLTVDAEVASVTLKPTDPAPAGALRLTRGLALRVSSYSAFADVKSGGQERRVDALRAIEITSVGHPPAGASPLTYDTSDMWDQRFLGDAIEVGAQLDALAAAYSNGPASAAPRAASFYRQIVPPLADEVDFTTTLIDDARPQGDTLVGAAIAALGKQHSFVTRWQEVFAFHDEGARWGIVALDQGVTSGPLVDTVEFALDASEVELAAAVPEPPSGPALDTGGGSPPPTTSPSPPTTTPPSPPPTTPPPDTPGLLPDTGIPLLDDLLQPIDDILSGLLRG